MIAIGSGSQALGYNTNGLAIGTQSLANGTDVTALGAGATATGSKATAIGAGATATHARSTAIGAGAITTRPGQIMLGTGSSEITAPSLAGPGNQLLSAGPDGTFQRTNIKTSTIPKLESSARGLGQAVEASGAIASAMSAVPEVSLMDDEPVRCGVGTGGFGSQYAVAAGCAVRVADRLHLNGALSYTPSIDYRYGDTPSMAGRLGFSFPLWKVAKATTPPQVFEKTSANQAYLSTLEDNIDQLKDDLQSRDDQIEALKSKLDALLNAQPESPTAEATMALIASLQERIKELEAQKLAAEGEDSKLHSMIDELKAENQSLRSNLSKIMKKLGLKD